MDRTNIVICGAGIAGIATAWSLAVKYSQSNIVLIDRQQPLSLTTSKSGENFRDYWPQPCMTALTGRSLELIDQLAAENDDVFNMRYSGYDFVSESPGQEIFPSDHLQNPDNEGNLIRVLDQDLIRRTHPWLSAAIRQMVHIKRAGALDVYALGSLMLALAKQAGVKYRQAHVESIEKNPSGFYLRLDGADGRKELATEKLVLCPGPFINEFLSMLNIRLPVESILQRKFIIPDPLEVIPRDMPFTIFSDAHHLIWNEEERDLISVDPEFCWLLDEFPAGLHIKPEGRANIKLGWAYNRKPEEPRWENPDDFDFPNITLRGASRFIPALSNYVDQPPTPIVQFSGYYTRTPENLPLIGPLPGTGIYTVSALSGYGTMAACGAGELCADWMMGARVPAYSRYFHPGRYGDSGLMAEINKTASDGQL